MADDLTGVAKAHVSVAYAAQARLPDQVDTPLILLITHPRPNVLHNFAVLVQHKIISADKLRLVGIYHVKENEDYQTSRDYLKRNHLDWITLQPITCDLSASQVYKNNACRQEFTTLLAESDGIVFNGGADIPPSLYGEKTLMTTDIETPMRHIFEVALGVQMLGSTRAPDVVPLLQHRRDYPVLGICVGAQTLNVAAGGTLIQDIPSQIYHQNDVEDALNADPLTWHRNHSRELGSEDTRLYSGVLHPIHVTPDAPSFMHIAAKGGTFEPRVLCIHHQAVDKVAPPYVVMATSDDGKVIEALGRHDFANVLAVQFHPEREVMWDKAEHAHKTPNSKVDNFVYDAMAHDPLSRTVNAGVWQWLVHAMQQARHPTQKISASPS